MEGRSELKHATDVICDPPHALCSPKVCTIFIHSGHVNNVITLLNHYGFLYSYVQHPDIVESKEKNQTNLGPTQTHKMVSLTTAL